MAHGSNNSPETDAIVRALLGLDPPRKTTLADLAALTPAKPTTRLGDIFVSNPPPPSWASFGSFAPSPPPPQPGTSFLQSLGINPLAGNTAPGLGIAPRPRALPVAPIKAPSSAPIAAPLVRRKAFFSFHFADIMRVNNVRMRLPGQRFLGNFYDRSLWERTKLTNPEGLKKLIRDGMRHSSAVCVLVGTGTHARRWVKYEIARAVVDGKGLFAVHINGLPHVGSQSAHPLGFNPLRLMAVGKSSGKFFLYENERTFDPITSQFTDHWRRYLDYTQSVDLPQYLDEPNEGYVMPLSSGTDEYDYMSDGRQQLGAWIDKAARRVGR
jgi:hypothetical protein